MIKNIFFFHSAAAMDTQHDRKRENLQRRTHRHQFALQIIQHKLYSLDNFRSCSEYVKKLTYIDLHSSLLLIKSTRQYKKIR